MNPPASYRHWHHLPESYPVIEGHTPRSVWLPTGGEVGFDAVMNLLCPFGDAPLVVKDFVKSQKHAWEEACFIPSASARKAVERVVRRFVELQGSDSLVAWCSASSSSWSPRAGPRSGMLLTLEYRLFFLDGRPLLCTEYWEEGDYGGEGPPVERFTGLAAKARREKAGRRGEGDREKVTVSEGPGPGPVYG